jgi:hypothetical protein
VALADTEAIMAEVTAKGAVMAAVTATAAMVEAAAALGAAVAEVVVALVAAQAVEPVAVAAGLVADRRPVRVAEARVAAMDRAPLPANAGSEPRVLISGRGSRASSAPRKVNLQSYRWR